MKWIGQHIYDLIARFRSDVYLEDIDTGTIASGGNLGLDSNNKIVKAASGSGDLTLTNETDNRVVTSTGGTGLNAEEFFLHAQNSTLNILQLLSPEDSGDYLDIRTTTHGATTITTTDDDATAAHFEVAADGNITLDAAGTTTIESAGLIKLDSGAGVEIENAAASGASALLIDNNDTDGNPAITIDQSQIATASGAIRLNINDPLPKVVAKGILLDWDDDNGDTTHSYHGIDLDYYKITNMDSSKNLVFEGCRVTANDSATGNAAQSSLTGYSAALTHASANGPAISTCFSGTITGGDSAYNNGLFLRVENGGNDFKFHDSANLFNYSSWQTGADGATTITTVDADAALAHFEVAADGDITLDAAGDIALEAAGGDITGDADNYSFTSSSSGKPLLTLETTNTTNNTSAELKFLKDAADTSDGEYLGSIGWYGDNDAGTPEEIQYGQILVRTGDVSDGTERGNMYLKVAEYDGNLNTGLSLFGTDTNGEIDVTIGAGSDSLTTIAGDLTVTTEATIPSRKFTATSATHFEYQGDVLYFGGGSTTQGDLCYLKEDGEWGQANATGAATGDDADRDAMGMLAIALGTDPDVDGMFIRGTITMDYDLGDVGNPIYIKGFAGAMAHEPPTTSGHFVRIVGYCLSDTDGQIYFNPDNTWVEIA